RVGGPAPWELWVLPGSGSVLGGLAEVCVGVLGVAVTVVSIIVELASNRYTPRITEIFLRDRLNLVALSFFVLTSVVVLWVELSVGPLPPTAPPPRAMMLVADGMLSLSLLGLLPYFAYVFTFLSPTRLVARLADEAEALIEQASQPSRTLAARRAVVVRLEQLGDVALKSVQNEDRAIAAAAVRAVGEVLDAAGAARARLPDAWYDARELLGADPDFVAYDPEVLDAIVGARTWLELKALVQVEAVFRAAVPGSRDIAHLVGIVLRRVAVGAAARGDRVVVETVLRFLNTALRAAINAHDVRTAYHLLSEYRLLAAGLLGTPVQDLMPEVAERMKGYGQLAFRAQLPFVLETVAYDLCTVIEAAWRASAPEHDALLRVFLDVDREADSVVQEAALRGVRKAQIKLATFYLQHGEEVLARRIHADMGREDPARMRGIREEIESTPGRWYWEVSDRGVNFDWIEPERRAWMTVFFRWFDDADLAH
ncbi:MAG TPA: DUF2254 family protein, partial [Myxococcota bacterium]|nr:DUF2254 family protein [Myxococcota bacterium]